MAPINPHWVRPSHPDVQQVVESSPSQFLTKSYSKINLPPFAVFAKFDFPPCTEASQPTYATVQFGINKHLNLNSDLVYINHSCDPSLIFDMSSLCILAAPKGLRVGQELTFFYPSTEWDMSQGFDCFCGESTCRGYINGAKNMPSGALSGVYLNAHIRKLLAEKNTKGSIGNGSTIASPTVVTEAALRASIFQAQQMVDAAQKALDTYKSLHGHGMSVEKPGTKTNNGSVSSSRHGVSNREMSGEMGGDTKSS